jgi:hypothetical protein
MPDARATTAQNRVAYASAPAFNKEWLIYSEGAASGVPPTATIEFVLQC